MPALLSTSFKSCKSSGPDGTHARIVAAILGVGAPRGRKEDPPSIRRSRRVALHRRRHGTVAMVTRTDGQRRSRSTWRSCPSLASRSTSCRRRPLVFGASEHAARGQSGAADYPSATREISRAAQALFGDFDSTWTVRRRSPSGQSIESKSRQTGEHVEVRWPWLNALDRGRITVRPQTAHTMGIRSGFCRQCRMRPFALRARGVINSNLARAAS
jgi:hypothetical protein